MLFTVIQLVKLLIILIPSQTTYATNIKLEDKVAKNLNALIRHGRPKRVNNPLKKNPEMYNLDKASVDPACQNVALQG